MEKDLYILGISCFFHDSSVTLLKNGKIVFALEEEKLTRIKHDNSFPKNAINICLKEFNLSIDEIDHVGFYEKPFLKFEHFLENSIKTWPFGYSSFVKGIKEWLKYKLFFKSILRKKTGYKKEIIYINHHLSHASGAFFSSPFENSAILTLDGVGELETTTWGVGNGNEIEIKENIVFPYSIGLLYSTFTAFLGFEVNEGEYKMMGLAPYGKPMFYDLIKNNLLKINPDSSFELNMEYFSYEYGKQMFNSRFENLFQIKKRNKNDEILEIHKNIAASIQKVTEEFILNLANYIYENTKNENLCISGGVGLNCVANYYLLKNSKFKNIYVQPSPGDSGSSIGVCYYIYQSILNHEKKESFSNIYIGNSFSEDEILETLNLFKEKINFQKLDFQELLKKTAKLIYENKVIGWFQDKAEFGPRALGNRSILGNPLTKENWQKINQKIKFRESFRPFAPAIVEEDLEKYYDLKGSFPYMLFIAKAKDKNLFPAVTHLDSSSRIQTVNKNENEKFYQLLKEFEKLSNFPILINTSFNLSGEPIVNSPYDTINTFLKCDMDFLVIQNYFISKI